MMDKPPKNRTCIRAQSAPWNRAIELMVKTKDGVVKDVVFEKHEDGMYVEPSFILDMDMAQTLIDDLWNAGLRPTEGAGSAGSLRATEKHLKDMRKIAFHSLEIGD